jgi:putative sterol carrier protein
MEQSERQTINKEDYTTDDDSTDEVVHLDEWSQEEEDMDITSDVIKPKDDYILIAEANKDLAAFQAMIGGKMQVILVDSCASISIVSEKFRVHQSK